MDSTGVKCHAWLVRIAIACVVFAVSSPSSALDPAYRQLSAKDIGKRLVGKAVTDDAHWSDHFHPDGVLQSYDLGRAGRGRWRVEGDELCLRRAARKPAEECFEIWVGGDAIQYRRDGVVVAEGFLRPIPQNERP